MSHTNKTTPGYMPRILRMLQQGELVTRPGQPLHIDVRHDHWCGALRGQRCTCEPDIVGA